VDCVEYAEQQLRAYNLSYTNMTAVVTDTEATMVSAGRLFVQNSIRNQGRTKWHGCVDHLLELVTGLAFSDSPETSGTMSVCRSIVNFFNSSTQAMAKLLSKQQAGRAVKPIQDVATRWWSTYSMVERLIRLKAYLAILAEEGELDVNLSNDQWTIAANLKVLLQPFMIAQRLLEGETYVTVSLIPYIIYKIRKGLTSAILNEHSSEHVVSTGRKMLQKFNELFGTGAEGTVAHDHLTEGPKRRPKGIPLLSLMASLLDPRMKGGIGIPELDKYYIWQEIKDEAIQIATEDAEYQQQQVELEEQPLDVEEEQEQHHQPHRHAAAIDNMFDELNAHYIEEQERINNINNNQNNALEVIDPIDAQRIIDSVDAELVLYKQEPSVPLQDHDGKFSCPLAWWYTNQRKYKMLSQVAIRTLCIPATSAPSERVYLVAGLTIAKDRARLAPQTANELIFLHDAVPALQRYEESRR
jgi:hypothetical protein